MGHKSWSRVQDGGPQARVFPNTVWPEQEASPLACVSEPELQMIVLAQKTCHASLASFSACFPVKELGLGLGVCPVLAVKPGLPGMGLGSKQSGSRGWPQKGQLCGSIATWGRLPQEVTLLSQSPS